MPLILEYVRNLIESAPVGIRTFDLSGQCVSANCASARILGASIEVLLSQNFSTLGAWRSSGLLDAALDTLSTGRSRRILEDIPTGLGADARLDSQFARFSSGGRPYLLQVIVDAPVGKGHGS